MFFGEGLHLGSADKLVLTEVLLDQLTDFKPLSLGRQFIRQDGEPFPHGLAINKMRSALSNGKNWVSDSVGDLRVR